MMRSVNYTDWDPGSCRTRQQCLVPAEVTAFTFTVCDYVCLKGAAHMNNPKGIQSLQLLSHLLIFDLTQSI